MRSATRVLGVVSATVGLMMAGSAVLAFADDGPTTNPLDLKVDRVEHATRSDGSGLAGGELLFDPEDSAALAAAAARSASARADQVTGLFVEQPGRSSGGSVTEPELLFPPSYSSTATARPVAGASIAAAAGESAGGVVLLGVIGVAVVGGCAAAYVLRGRGEVADGQ